VNRRLLVWIGVAFMAVYLFGNEGFRKGVTRFREKRRLEKTLARLRSEHEKLAQEWTLIQQDPSYAEYLIRKNLGFVKQGEVEYRILPPAKSSVVRVQSSEKAAH
jgi:cell division protein FtsB